MKNYYEEMVVLDDGYIEMVLKEAVFDEYIFQKVKQDQRCLPCHFDVYHRVLTYDYSTYLPLTQYLKTHIFEEVECYEFLLFFLQECELVCASKPIFLDVSYIYIHPNQKQLSFLALPIECEAYYFVKTYKKQCIYDLVKQIIIQEQGYEAFGYLFYMLEKNDVGFPMLMQGLQQLKEAKQTRIPWWKRWFVHHEEEPYKLQEVPNAQVFTRRIVRNDECTSYNQTQVLIQSAQCYFMNEQQQKFYINTPETRIGRDDDNEIQIDDPYVSKRHACFQLEQYLLIDLDSRNKTFVNDVEIKQQVLQQGDCVRFGNSTFYFYRSSL